MNENFRQIIWEAREFLDPRLEASEPEAAHHIATLCNALEQAIETQSEEEK